jgi:hypothetical protein
MSDSESVISSSQDNEEHDETSTAYTDDSSCDEENTCTIRGKWIFDGSESIDDMIACLQKEVDILTELKENGWFLTQKVDDDYAFLRRDTVDDETGN